MRLGAASTDSEALDQGMLVASLGETAYQTTVLTADLEAFGYFREISTELGESALQALGKSIEVQQYQAGCVVLDPEARLHVLLHGQVRLEQGNSTRVIEIGGCLVDVRTESQNTGKYVCTEPCLFAVCDKTVFLRILSEAKERKITEFVKFAGKLPFFQHWRHQSLVTLCTAFTSLRAHKHTLLYREGSPSLEVFIVKSGEIGLVKSLTTFANPIFPPVTATKRQVTLAILGPGELIGVEEVVEGIVRTNSAVCRSMTASLLCISAVDFQRLVLQNEGWERSKALLASKLAIRDSLYQRLSRPLKSLDLPPEQPQPPLHPSPKTERHSLLASPCLSTTISRPSPGPHRRTLIVPHLAPFPQLTATPRDLVHFPSPEVSRTYSHHKYPRRVVKVKSKTSKRISEMGLGEAVSHSRYHFVALSGDMEHYLHRLNTREPEKAPPSQLDRSWRDISLEGKRVKRRSDGPCYDTLPLI